MRNDKSETEENWRKKVMKGEVGSEKGLVKREEGKEDGGGGGMGGREEQRKSRHK